MKRLALLAWVALAAACVPGVRVPKLRYYTLAVPGPPAAALPGPVEIGRFTADPPYARARIAYRTSPYQLEYYVYHRWAADPPRLLAMAFRDYLDRSVASREGPPFVVDAHIRRLEEVDTPEGWSGALTVAITVRRTGEIVLQQTYAETEPAERRSPEAVVAALSRALGRVLDRVAVALAAQGAPRDRALPR